MGANNSLCPSGAVRVDRDTYDTLFVCVHVRVGVGARATCAYINCISPLNGASWLTDCALLIRIPIIGEPRDPAVSVSPRPFSRPSSR